jgi:hypothetical protein
MELVLTRIKESQFQDSQRRKRAKRAWKRREKRRLKRAAFADEALGNGSVLGPADRPESSEGRVSGEIPTEDWIPQDCSPTNEVSNDPKIEVADEQHTAIDVSDRDRSARRLLRALKKIAYDRLREERGAHKELEKPVKLRIYLTLADQVGIEHLKHRIGRREVYEVEHGAWHKLRKKFIQKFRLKGLNWNLWVMSGGAWACLPKVPRVSDQDELRLEVWGKKVKTPNKPGSTKRRHFDRPNQRRSRKSFEWTPPGPKYRDVATTGKLAAPGQIGFRELADQSPQDDLRDQREKSQRALDALQVRKNELGRELGERTRVEASVSPDETARLRQEVEELERLRAAKQQLDDRDEARRERDKKFRATYVEPPRERHQSETEKSRRSVAKEAKEAQQAEFLRQLQTQREEKEQRQKEKKAEGQARQAKAEARTKKKGSR